MCCINCSSGVLFRCCTICNSCSLHAVSLGSKLRFKQYICSCIRFSTATCAVPVQCNYNFLASYGSWAQADSASTGRIAIDAPVASSWSCLYIHLFDHVLFTILTLLNIVSNDLITTRATRIDTHITLYDLKILNTSCQYVLLYV